MTQEFSKAMFSPSEAASISGMNVETQRNNRRSGYWKKESGHARYDLFDLMRLAFMSEAAKFGIGPKISSSTSEWVAHHALFFALLLPEVTSESSEDGCSIGRAMRIFSSLFGRPRIYGNPVAVFWPDGTDYYCQDIDEALSSLDKNDPRKGQPVLVIDVPSFAQKVVNNMKRPAVLIM